MRATWGPKSEDEILELQEATGIALRFVIGFSESAEEMNRLREEEKQYGKMIRLDVKEKYHNLVLKMRRFMQWSVQNYDFAFLVKVTPATQPLSASPAARLCLLSWRRRGEGPAERVE